MEMEIEIGLRSRIEAILANDARNYDEMKKMAVPGEPMEVDGFAEERNVFQRIINTYRRALGEVNGKLEEQVEFLSGLAGIVEHVKRTGSLREMCSHIVDCLLRDFGIEYCGIFFFNPGDPASNDLCLEGVMENCGFVNVHTDPVLLGSREFRNVLVDLDKEPGDCLSVGDVYRDPRFNCLDFPTVVRALVCIPLTRAEARVGMIVLGHSRPGFFSDNHIRFLKILGGIMVHLRLLTSACGTEAASLPAVSTWKPPAARKDLFSVLLLDFTQTDAFGKTTVAEKAAVNSIRRHLMSALRKDQSILFYGEAELLVLLPGIAAGELPRWIELMSDLFLQWKEGQGQRMHGIRMSFGYSVAEGDAELSQILEVASLVRHPVCAESGATCMETSPSPGAAPCNAG